MIKAIFFDFDGVFTTHLYSGFTIAKNISEKTGIDPEKIMACERQIGKPVKLGQETFVDNWDKFCDCLGEKIDVGILDFVWKNVPVNKEMESLARNLKVNGYKLGIISSNYKERVEALEEEFKLSDIFDVTVGSYDGVGDKTQPDIFELALEKVGVRPEEAVFVDNHEHNLEGATKIGMNTYYFDCEKGDVGAFKKQLELWGVKVN